MIETDGQPSHLTSYNNHGVIEQFRSLGDDSSSFNWAIAGVGAAILGVIGLIKRRIPFGLLGIEASYVFCALFHVPSAFTSAAMYTGLATGFYFDFKKFQPNRRWKGANSPWFLLLVFPVTSLALFLMAPNITLNKDSLFGDRQTESSVVERNGLQVTIYPSNPKGGGKTWRFTSRLGDFSVSHNQIFVDSRGHFYRGDDIGRMVEKWGNVKPQFVQGPCPTYK